MPTFAELVEAAVRHHRDAVAWIDPASEATLTYADFDRVAEEMAATLLHSGSKAGDHVGIMQRNSYRWLAAEAAIAKAGMVTVPLSVYLSPRELAWLQDHSRAAAVLFDAESGDALHAACELATSQPLCLYTGTDPGAAPDWASTVTNSGRTLESGSPRRSSPDAPHRIMYTSGTTGQPKGVLIPNHIVAQSVNIALANQLHDLAPGDVLIAPTPLTHVANGFAWTFFAYGCPTVIMRRYTPAEFCDLVNQFSVTHAVLAPTLLADLVEHLERQATANPSARRGGTLRAIWYAGSPIPATLAARAEELLGPILNQQYGCTEMLSGFPAYGITQLTSQWHHAKPGSAGRPIIGASIAIVCDDGTPAPQGDRGEVCLRMSSPPAGYWALGEGQSSSFSDGWLHTGDIGYFDDDGFLYLCDRKNDMIVTGGLNVYPTEVEQVLVTHPDVKACAVVGVSDPRWVEVPCAVVVSEPGAEADEGELIAYCRARLAHFKCPKLVRFREELPTNATGKVLRRELRAWLSEIGVSA